MVIIKYPKQIFLTINKHNYKGTREQVCKDLYIGLCRYETNLRVKMFPRTKSGGCSND